MEELQWHLYAVAVMLGVVYSQTTDSHVRVDALSRRFTRRTRRIVEICGTALLFIPFCVVVFLHGLDFVYDSWRVNERSDSPVGLPAPMAYQKRHPHHLRNAHPRLPRPHPPRNRGPVRSRAGNRISVGFRVKIKIGN